MKNLPSLVLLICILAVTSCKNQTREKDTFTPVAQTDKATSTVTDVKTEKEEIKYGLLTPAEVCEIFNRLEVSWSRSFLNPVSNSDLYLNNSQAAIATGIYGVDFGYLKMFGTGQDLLDYLNTIRKMSDKLGIPDNLIVDPLRKIENDISDPDTITKLMKKVYSDIVDHLKQEDNQSTAALMMMGGWVEAMYLATQLAYNPLNPDEEVVRRIAGQKYTLKSLLSFMKNYYDDPVVAEYTRKLKFLNNYFDTFEIIYEKGDLEIDTALQVIRSSGSKPTITTETLSKISDYISKLREELVSP